MKRRERTRALLLRTTLLTILGVAGLAALFGLRRPAPPPIVDTPIDGGARGAVARTAGVPIIVLRGGRVLLDGVEVGTTEPIVASGRARRVDGLYDALKRRREERDPGERSVILDAAWETPAIVIKSVFQTAVLAGYGDVAFAVRDAGTP